MLDMHVCLEERMHVLKKEHAKVVLAMQAYRTRNWRYIGHLGDAFGHKVMTNRSC